MSILPPILLILIVSAIVLWFCLPTECEHEYHLPIRLTVGDWKETEYEMPQLPGEKIKCYRRDVTFSMRCKKCGVHTRQNGYDQKPHESDRMVADLKAHGVDESFEPAPAPTHVLDPQDKRYL